MGAFLAMRLVFSTLFIALSLSACGMMPFGPKGASSNSKVVVLNTTKSVTPTIRVFLESRGASAVLAQASTLGSVTSWTDESDVSVSLNNGVVVETRGLGDDIMSSDVSNSLKALRGDFGDSFYERFQTSLSGELETEFRAFQCQISDRTNATIKINSITLPVTKIVESCATIGFSVSNIYWQGANGVLLRSRQWISEGVGHMTIEQQPQ